MCYFRLQCYCSGMRFKTLLEIAFARTHAMSFLRNDCVLKLFTACYIYNSLLRILSSSRLPGTYLYWSSALFKGPECFLTRCTHAALRLNISTLYATLDMATSALATFFLASHTRSTANQYTSGIDPRTTVIAGLAGANSVYLFPIFCFPAGPGLYCSLEWQKRTYERKVDEVLDLWCLWGIDIWIELMMSCKFPWHEVR